MMMPIQLMSKDTNHSNRQKRKPIRKVDNATPIRSRNMSNHKSSTTSSERTTHLLSEAQWVRAKARYPVSHVISRKDTTALV
jgi:hypothetical protein